MTPNPTESDLETAFEVALGPYFSQDCITATFATDRGDFVIELGAFDDELPFNVAALPRDLEGSDFTDATEFDVIDSGANYCMLSSASESPSALVDDAMTIAGAVDAELANIEPKTVEWLPDWWPESLNPY